MSASDEDIDLGAAMAAAQAGDGAAYRRLLRTCMGPIRAVAQASGVPRDALDDVVQDCLIALHGARHTYDPARPFLPWLNAIARRRAVDFLRRHGRTGARERHDPVAFGSAVDPEIEATARIEAAERQRLLRAAVETLPPAQRQAVEQLGFGERSLAEASAATGRSTVSLKVNLHRALAGLRARLRGREQADE